MDEAELAFAGIARQAELVASGELAPREIVETYLRRIECLDPQLNAFRIVFAERALSEARDKEGKQGGPLHGVPIAVKDDLDVAGEVTALGTRAHGGPAAADAEFVQRLRDAGAIVLGKTNVPELCIWPFTESATWGITRNPWDPDRAPGGSSGGTAAAVAAGLVGAGTGSDGGGSIRIPAAWCGLFGLKPQRGRVPLTPRPEAWHGLSANGVLARSVADSALLYDVASGAGRADLDSVPKPPRSFTEAASSDPGALRVALSTKVPTGLIAPVAPELRRAVEDTAELLSSLGHEVEEHDPQYGPADILLFSARYLRGIHDDAAALPHRERLERRTRSMARAGGLIPDALLARARAAEEGVRVRLTRALEHHDVLLTPATAQLAPPVGRYEGHGFLWTFNGVSAQVPFTPLWNLTGQPAAAVPAGFTPAGLPLSVQLVGRPGDEATLLSLAAQIEGARPWAGERPALAA